MEVEMEMELEMEMEMELELEMKMEMKMEMAMEMEMEMERLDFLPDDLRSGILTNTKQFYKNPRAKIHRRIRMIIL